MTELEDDDDEHSEREHGESDRERHWQRAAAQEEAPAWEDLDCNQLGCEGDAPDGEVTEPADAPREGEVDIEDEVLAGCAVVLDGDVRNEAARVALQGGE